MYYVYILKLSDGRYYKGQTRDIGRRLKQHESGRVESTKSYLPYELVHVEICGSRLDARKLEKYFKSGFGREIIGEFV
jgi:putative endonuclease